VSLCPGPLTEGSSARAVQPEGPHVDPCIGCGHVEVQAIVWVSRSEWYTAVVSVDCDSVAEEDVTPR
jgi:hypothetical protein